MNRKTSQTITPEQRREAQALCAELPLLEDRLRRAGLFGTATLLNKAVQNIGYELAELGENTDKARKAEKAPA